MEILILHPGAMGASVGSSLIEAGHSVSWISEGRSKATVARATRAGLSSRASLDQVDAIVSVCPPHAALDVADFVVGHGFRGLYVDANAIAPDTAQRVASTVRGAGIDYVDGGIIGPPAWKAGTTRMYVSGTRASEVAGAFNGGPLDVIALEVSEVGASALKMAYAAWTKGVSALLISIRAFATASGVDEALLDEWKLSATKLGIDLAAKSDESVSGAAPKAWRFVGEMEEIAASFERVGLPGDFHAGAAALYRQVEEFKDASPTPTEVLSSLVERRAPTDADSGSSPAG